MEFSDKRREASRINGAKSRGPVTPRGKYNSSRARLRHGMLSRTLLLDCESNERFHLLLKELRREFRPETSLEHSLIETMATCRWRIMRLWGLEKASMSHEMRQLSVTPGFSEQDEPTQVALAFRQLADTSRSLEILSRYETRFSRQFNQALRELRENQRERRKNARSIDPGN